VCAAATEQMEINAQFYAVMQAVANQVEKSKQRFVPSFPSTPFGYIFYNFIFCFLWFLCFSDVVLQSCARFMIHFICRRPHRAELS
jgi:hypothetical protein